MESLIKASEQHQAVAKEEKINTDLFNEFMKKITVWDYSCISREHYLSLPNHEKQSMIKKYYYDMKSCSSSKDLIIC